MAAENTGWRVTREKMALAKKHAVYMHCMPIDRHHEADDDVIDGPQSIIYKQAENRLHIQKALMALVMGGRGVRTNPLRITRTRTRSRDSQRKRRAMAHPTLWITHRGERHQQAALISAPPELAVTIRRSPSKEEVLELLPGMEFLLSERTGAIDADMIAAGKQLRLIQRLGSQTYDIDLTAAQAASIPVCYAPVRGCIMVAEHMLMQILALAKRVRELMVVVQEGENFGFPPRRCDEDYFAYNWAGYRGATGLWGSTVGVLGMGEIGAELARLLRPFGCTLLYNKRNRLPEEAEAALGARFATVDVMAATSDVICMLLPFFPETEQSLSADFFAAMKPGSLFVSCGGSGVVDEKALTEALRSGHLAGAALDTFTYEPIAKDDPMRALAADLRANVILTPHTAAGTGPTHPIQPRAERAEDYDNLLRCLRGEPLTGRLV